MRAKSISGKGGVCGIALVAAIAILSPTTAFAASSMEHYISEVDGSSQPFGLYLPGPFDPNVPHPVVIHLHGGGGSANTNFTLTDESRQWIMVKPDARGQHPIYTGLRENDLFRVLHELRSTYPNAVDDNRIYITGCSSGGFGSARLASTYSDVFAAAAPIDGWYDNLMFHRDKWAPLAELKAMHPARVPLLEGLSPLYIAEDAKNLNLYLCSDTNDTSPAGPEGPKFHAQLDELGCAHSYHTKPAGHCGGNWTPEIYQFFSEHVREPNPKHVVLKANQLKFGSAYWVRMHRMENSAQFATIDASVTGKERDRVEVTASALFQYTLFLTPELMGEGVEEVTVLANGELIYIGPPQEIRVSASMDESGNIIGWSTDDILPRGLRKTPEIEGPISHAYMSRFLLVVGTISKPDTPGNRGEAEQFAADWNLRNRANISPVDDTSITEEDMAGSNLILFGTADSNSIIAAINDLLPIRISRNRIVAGANVYEGENYGLYIIFANPLNPETYVVISHGTIPGWVTSDVPFLPPQWPDYVVFDTNIVPREAAEGPFGGPTFYHPDAWAEAGFFEQYWRLDNDEDGLDDIFEKGIIDADPDDQIASIADVHPGDDFDGDGQDNRTEYNAGTDPISPDSLFSVLSPQPDPAHTANFQVSWKVAPGRSYYILWSDSMDGPWHEIAELVPGDISDDGDTRTWTDRGTDPTMAGTSPGDCPARFYKLAAYR